MEFFVTLPQDNRRQTVHLAAALCSLGCEVRTDLIHDARTRTQSRTFSIGASDRVMVYGTTATGESSHRHILNLWRTGETPPDHEFNDCIRGLLNYEWVQCAQAGTCGALRLAQDGPQRTRYIGGSEMPSLTATPRARCDDARKIAALGILGIPLQKLEGNIATLGMGIYMPGQPQPYDPAEILQLFKEEKLPTDHPFVTAWNACRYLDAMDKHLDTEEGKILYAVKPTAGETRPQKAYVTPNAPGDVMDRARRFIETGR